MSPPMTESNVVLPEPLGPESAVSSPERKVRSMSESNGRPTTYRTWCTWRSLWSLIDDLRLLARLGDHQPVVGLGLDPHEGPLRPLGREVGRQVDHALRADDDV